MRFARMLAGLLSAAVLTTACGSTEGGSGGLPGEDGGILLLDTGLALETLYLDGSSGGSELRTGGSTISALHPADGHLYLVRYTMADPFTVQPYDPIRLTADGDPVEWPETSLFDDMSGLAFSPDGRYAAAIVSDLVSDYLDVVDLSSGEPQQVLRGFKDVTGSSLVWLNNTELAFSMDVSILDDPPVADYEGAIVSVDVVEAAAGPEPDLTVIARFDDSQWLDLASVTGLTVNAARDELLFSLEGEVHVKDAPFDVEGSAPHQLTEGSLPHFGAVFSPDGDQIAFVEYTEEFASDIFVIPNHRGSPIDPSADQLVTRTNVQRLVAWLP